MKTAFILFFILVILGLNAEAGAPYGIKGQEQSTTLYSNVHQFANKQVTNIGGINALVQDCGSSANLLENCGFEHSTFDTAWVDASIGITPSPVVETTKVIGGKKSLYLSVTKDVNLYQDTSLYAAQFASGLNGSITINLHNNISNLYVCQRKAGALVASSDGTKITNCIQVATDAKWAAYTMPIILGGTSNGIAVVSLNPATAASIDTSGNLYVDQAILEAGLKTAIVPNIGPWTTGTCTSSWTTNTTTTCKYRQVGDSAEIQFLAALTGAPNAANLTFNMPTGLTINSSKLSFGVAPSYRRGTGSTVAAGAGYDLSGDINNSTSSIRALVSGASGTYTSIPALVSNTIPATYTNGDMVYLTVTVPITQFSNSLNVYTVPSDSFSTDTNQLSHKTSALTSANAIGDYVTYSYAINTNTKTICGSAPSILPNAADGFKIFTRAYNAASTCGNPARVEIKIAAAGTKLPTIKTDIYKSAAKVTSGALDFTVGSTTAQNGASTNSYDESTGVLIIDIGLTYFSTNTSNTIAFSDNSYQTSGFLVINAQKMKDSIVGSFAEVVTSQGTTSPDIQSVYFADSVACTTGTCVSNNLIGNKITSVTWVSTGVYRLNGINGTKYNCTGSSGGGAYKAVVHFNSLSTASYAQVATGSGATASDSDSVSVICIGKP